MEMFGKIRRMYLRDKLSLHEIAKRTGLSRNTIRNWVRSTKEATPPTYCRGEAPCKLTAFHEALEQALKADAHRTKQNRRTAKALFEQIKAERLRGGGAIAASPTSSALGGGAKARRPMPLCR